MKERAWTGRDRVAEAMRLGTADRVPVFCQLALGHYFLQAGLPPHAIWFTSDGFADALVRLQRRYRFDGILVNLPGRPPGLLDQLVGLETTPEGERLVWPDGSTTRIPPDDNPHHLPADGGELPRADLAQLDPDRLDALPAGYTWNIYHVPAVHGLHPPGLVSKVPDYFLDTIRRVQALTRGEVSVHGEVFSPFTHLLELLGYQEAMVALVTEPAKVHALLHRLTEPAIAWGSAQARAGVDAVLVSSAFAGGGFISRRAYADFVVPYERRVHAAIQALGVPTYTHTCGRIGDRLDLLLESGTRGVDTLDPPPLGTVELASAKQIVRGRAFIKGNLNSVALLAHRTRAAVEREVLDCLKHGMPHGGYILSTACSVAPRVEPWKLELLTSLAESHGRYAPPSLPS